MRHEDEVDDLLTKAGAQWRAEQPSAPEPDLDRIQSGAGRKRRWVPVLAAASVAAIATAALVVLPESGKEPTPPAASEQASPKVAQGNIQDDRVVRDGDKVAVDGQVVAAPGKPVQYCVPVATPAIGRPPGTAPACAEGESIEVTGVDLNRLSSPQTVNGVRTGLAHLEGIWNAGKIAVEKQGAPVPEDLPALEVPCAPPAGGWKKVNDAEAISPAVQKFVDARSSQLQEPWIGWPEGYPSTQTPSVVPSKPSVVMIGVAHGDLAAIRTALDPLVAGNLCVMQVKLSRDEIKAIHAKVVALPAAKFHIYAVGNTAGAHPVSVDLRIFDEQTAAALTPFGLDNLTLNPVVKPVR